MKIRKAFLSDERLTPKEKEKSRWRKKKNTPTREKTSPHKEAVYYKKKSAQSNRPHVKAWNQPTMRKAILEAKDAGSKQGPMGRRSLAR